MGPTMETTAAQVWLQLSQNGLVTMVTMIVQGWLLQVLHIPQKFEN
jgi:hypothetical protein